jgi:DNA repair protein RecN (Recombination protein N)
VIEEIRITGLGVIDDAVVELGPGLTVVTGETGAGKTMVVTSIGMLLGARADAALVRSGHAAARVEGRVVVAHDGAVAERVTEAGGALDDDVVTLARQVSAEGRSRAWVGGRGAPVALLGELADHLVAVHGQSDQHGLLAAARQRDILDAYAGDEVAEPLTSYTAAYARLREVQATLDELRSRTEAQDREVEMLRAGLDEIEAADPQPGEDAALSAESSRLAHADELRAAADAAHTAVGGDDSTEGTDAVTLVGEAKRALDALRDRDPRLAELADRATESTFALSELAADLSAYAADIDVDPARLAAVEERRAVLGSLLRRHGVGSVDELLAWSEQASRRLLDLDGSDERLAALAEERESLRARLAKDAARLTTARRAAGDRFGAAVTTELAALAMPKAEVTVEVAQRDDADGLLVDGRTVAFGPTGVDDVAVRLRPHPGSEPRPLHKGASGGELSRVMLAVEVVLAGTDPVPTFVFDEVDSGVGGKAATEVGRRLAVLARGAQVLVVTHLPQVAAFADRHVVVQKADDGAVTSSDVTTLDAPGRVRELARMLAGVDDSASALAHAEELVAAAEEFRAASSKQPRSRRMSS